MTALPSLADVYFGAAQILRTLGWVQDRYVDNGFPPERPLEECPVCLIEAIFRAAGLPPQTWPDGHDDSEDQAARWELAETAAEALATRLGYDLDKTPEVDKPDRAYWLITWNDVKTRTRAEVLAALDEAARDAASQHASPPAEGRAHVSPPHRSPAQRKTAEMGAIDFTSGPWEADTAAAAFSAAVQEARRFSTRGSIADKDDAGFVVVCETPLPLEIAESFAHDLMEAEDPRVNDKWGPAGAIPVLVDGPNNPQWYFFGWAAR
ncbi:hypothetical protein GCM10009733_008510 [Nonomuraea maheshkhaliensis]|uniref:Uncharacterized protein n=1 Tax=Nonomuraea maheshkhaliensis TaxID=419590 RepID=A0ABN2EQG3_9ACTN